MVTYALSTKFSWAGSDQMFLLFVSFVRFFSSLLFKFLFITFEILILIANAQKYPLNHHTEVAGLEFKSLVLSSSTSILLCMQAAKALASLHISKSSPEPLLLDNATSTLFLTSGIHTFDFFL